MANRLHIKYIILQQVISTRNKITHEYDEIDNYNLFVIVTKYLPLHYNEVIEVLNNH